MSQFHRNTTPAQSTGSNGQSQPPPSTTSDAPGDASGHKRVYQACIPCRRRKVRCDLGSVDNPHDPPCVRCRRESKHCYFSATRRKRKTDDPADALASDEDEYTVRNGRKRLHASDSPPREQLDKRLFSDAPLTPGGSVGRSQPLRRPYDASIKSGSRRGDFPGVDEEPLTPLENLEARTLMRQEVYGQHDALDLLYKAATDSPRGLDPATNEADPGTVHSSTTQVRDHAPPVAAARQSRSRSNIPVDPQLTRPNADQEWDRPSLVEDPGYAEALRVWARFKFVRAGWFTAPEAIEYIDYYYRYLSPLTPISPPIFDKPANHLTLLSDEPILTVTLLTISSRYHTLGGTGGACRSYAIHEKLWTYLRGMIERVIWGQEAFGGGFCGSGAESSQTSSTAPWRGLRKGSLRTMGTIESLLIMTEWHPRALHFPPAEAMDELLLPSTDPRDKINGIDLEASSGGVFSGRRVDSWLEPAWRSDRMCWMLLSAAMGLAYELGVFDDIEDQLLTGEVRPEYEDESYRIRAHRIKRLLLIYSTQLAGRLGWTNMVPDNLRTADPVLSRKRPASVEGTTPGSHLSVTFSYVPDLELDDQVIHCWAGISNTMHNANEKLFRSRKQTSAIIQTGKYITLLRDFQPVLRDWKSQLDRCKLPTFIRHVLTIEYEYVRIYINSLSLQAVVERCASNAGNAGSTTNPGATESAPQLSPQTQNYFGQLPLGQLGGFGAADQEYVREVVEGSRNLLKTVVDGLLPGGYLKHAPVRTYFRIISGAMFLLKTFALGAPRSDVEISIALMDRTVDALRNCVVDDVHLGIRFADLLQSLTSRLRNRFIHAPTSATQTQAAEGDKTNSTVADALSVLNGNPDASSSWGKLHGLTAERSSTPANISATPFDPSTGTFPLNASLFGPSTPNAHGGLDGFENFDSSEWTNNDMWYLPTGPAFFQNVGENQNVSMTAEGVNVAGIDLLDYMAMDNPSFPGLDSSGF